MPNPTPPSELAENPQIKFKSYKKNRIRTKKHGLGDKKGFHDLLPKQLSSANLVLALNTQLERGMSSNAVFARVAVCHATIQPRVLSVFEQ